MAGHLQGNDPIGDHSFLTSMITGRKGRPRLLKQQHRSIPSCGVKRHGSKPSPNEPGSINSLYWGWSSMVIQPLIGNPYIGYINPYYWVDDHPLLYGST